MLFFTRKSLKVNIKRKFKTHKQQHTSNQQLTTKGNANIMVWQTVNFKSS